MKKNISILSAILLIGMLFLSACAEGMFGSLEELEEQAIEEASGGLTYTVTVSPESVMVSRGGSQKFTATVHGDGDPSQEVTWSVSGGGAGTSINSSGVLSVSSSEGVGKILTITATSTAYNRNGSATAEVSALAIAQTPNFTVQPQSTTTYTVGATAAALTSAASVSDGGTITYQWYSNNSPSNSGGTSLGSGAQTASYTPSTAAAGTTYYYVVATNTISDNGDGGAKTASAPSNTAAVTVSTLVDAKPPNITGHPTNANYTQGATATALTVTATSPDDGTLSYQWYSNGSNSNSGGTNLGSGSGANSASYTPPTITVGTTYYYVVVTNTNNSVSGEKTATATSNTATVTITTGIIAVTSISGIPSAATFGELILNPTVNPSNATNTTISWSISAPGTTGATVSGSTVTTTAAGSATILATITNGAGAGSNYTESFSINFTEPSLSGIWTSTDNTYKITFFNSTTGYVYLLENYSGGAFINSQKGTAVCNEAANTFTLKGSHSWSSGNWIVSTTSTPVTYTKSGSNWIVASGAPLSGKTFSQNGSYTAVASIPGVPNTGWGGNSITLPMTVTPSYATYQNIVWSVQSAGGTGATMTGVNTFTTNAVGGTVTVQAKILNGGPIPGDDYQPTFNITINDPNWYVGTWVGASAKVTFGSGGGVNFLLKNSADVNVIQGHCEYNNSSNTFTLTNVQAWVSNSWQNVSGTYSIMYTTSTPVGTTFSITSVTPSLPSGGSALAGTFTKQ